MATNFFIIFYWWFLIFLFGIVFLPATSFLFKGFFDRGYALSKIVGIVAVSYLVWLFGSLKALPFASETAWLIVIGLLAGNVFLVKKLNWDLKKKLRSFLRIMIFEELVFLAALVFWSWVRAYQPAIQGLEKFMDFGFVNAILRSKYFPPADMWLAGETINYYYFGHLITAVLTRLSGLDPAVTYNLMMATLFGFVFTGGFCLGGNLLFLNSRRLFSAKTGKGKQVVGFLKAGLSKNWKRVNKVMNFWPADRRIGPRQLPVIAGLISASLLTLGGNLHPLYWLVKNHHYRSYWYPDATRFIVEQFGAQDNTIHEFPLYSFVVADLHGHLINLPNILLILGLILILSVKIRQKTDWRKLWPWLATLSFCFSVAFMTNAWDYPIYLLVFGTVVFLSSLLAKSKIDAVLQTAVMSLFVLVGSVILALPFHLNFENIAQGLAGTDFHSPPWMLFVLWGWPLFLTVVFLMKFSKSVKNDHRPEFGDLFAVVLLVVSWLLIVVPEFVYVKDIYIHSHQRANTMFKLTYQSFVMFSLTGGFILIKTLAAFKKRFSKILFLIPVLFLSFFVLTYHRFAIQSYYGLKNYKGLYGLNYLQDLYPDDFRAVVWLQKNVSGQPVIVEAVGESYTDFARVSANTGLPAVLGWRVHEWLWRGSFDEAGKRTEEVKTIYESPDLRATKTLLNQYRVKYVFIGQLERDQYPKLNEAKFNQLGEAVFASGATKIYRIN